jgi:sialate O-acetylesterase
MAVPARATALSDVPEVTSQGYQLVYRKALTDTFGGGAFPYDVDNSGTTASTFDRVAYYLELQTATGSRQFVYASFDKLAGMTAANKTGVPTTASGEIFQQTLANMNVVSNVAGIVTGTGISTGNIEFWPSNYSQPNGIAIPNANAAQYDFGDTRTAGTYGSMQIHNYDLDGAGSGTAGQTLFAYNRWGGTSGTSDLGIGNRATADTDWTFAANANTYTVKNLEILVHPTPEPAGLGTVLGGGLLFLSRRHRIGSQAAR